MTRRSVTLTALNGAKVRTIFSKRYFVVEATTIKRKWSQKTQQMEYFEPRPHAEVVKRTNSAVTAWTELRKSALSRVVFEVFVRISGEVVVTDVTAHIYDAAQAEKAGR